MWIPDLASRSGPRYRAIADSIAEAVGQGVLAPGDKLPPQRQLAWRLEVTVGTVSRGYMLAEQRGLVSGEIGRGTFVRVPDSGGTAPLLPPAPDGVLELSINMSLGRTNADALARTLAELAAEPDIESFLRYMPPAGHPEHRAAAARWMARVGLEVAPERILLSHGAQQGLAACLDVLAAPGDTVLTEALSFPLLIDPARLRNIELGGVALDDEGMIPEALDEAAAKTKAKLVVIVPTVQNPTASVMGQARRRAVAQVAKRRDLVIVEDDVYGYLLPDRPPPIAAIAPERTVYLTSASKCLAPGLRVGWIVAPERLLADFSEALYLGSVAQPALTNEIVRRWIEDGTAEALAQQLGDEVAARQKLAAEHLAGLTLSGSKSSLHVMVELPRPWRRDEFVGAALDHGIRIASLSAFALDPEAAPEAVRLTLSAVPDRATLQRALTSLRQIAEAGPRAGRGVI